MSKSDLLNKDHTMNVVGVTTGDPDEPWDWRSHREVKCSCGFECRMPDSYWPDKQPSFGPCERHLQQVLLKHLGINTTITGRY